MSRLRHLKKDWLVALVVDEVDGHELAAPQLKNVVESQIIPSLPRDWMEEVDDDEAALKNLDPEPSFHHFLVFLPI